MEQFFLSGNAFFILMKAFQKEIPSNSDSFKEAFRKLNRKGIASSIGYFFFSIPLAFVSPVISGNNLFVIAVVWLIPDKKNIEKAIKSE